jgi:2TM domain
MSTQPLPSSVPARRRTTPDLRLIESKRAAKLHLFTYVLGNAIFWTLWAALSVSADDWYWWLAVPFVGWTIVLVLHIWHVWRPAHPRVQ